MKEVATRRRAAAGRGAMDLSAALLKIERMALQPQVDLQPAGTKRKLPERRRPSFPPQRMTRLERGEDREVPDVHQD